MPNIMQLLRTMETVLQLLLLPDKLVLAQQLLKSHAHC